MKKIVSMVLIIALLIAVFSINVVAIPAPCYFGDADANGERNVMDATFLQEFLARIKTITALQEKLGDVDADGEITVFDATMIQQNLAKNISEYPAGNEIYVYMLLDGFYTNRDSGTVTVNEPVTFKVFPNGKCEPFYFDYFVNGELLIDDSVSTSFTYSFDKPGSYRIEATATNSLGVSSMVSMNFVIIES